MSARAFRLPILPEFHAVFTPPIYMVFNFVPVYCNFFSHIIIIQLRRTEPADTTYLRPVATLAVKGIYRNLARTSISVTNSGPVILLEECSLQTLIPRMIFTTSYLLHFSRLVVSLGIYGPIHLSVRVW
jgi:hypothetical protein